jgi:hypothetical protein
MQNCKSCGIAKDAASFYESNRSKCKDCLKLAARNNRAANADRYRAYDAARADDPPRVAMRAAYAATDSGRAARSRAAKAYWGRNPERKKVGWIVSNAIRDGKLIRPETCSVPGCTAKPHAHHEDYTKPLEVEWLCPAHHSMHHKELKKA